MRAIVACLLIGLVALPDTNAAQKSKDPERMEWWEVCSEHGRQLRARTQDSQRGKLIEREALRAGFERLDIGVALAREPRLGMSQCAALAGFGMPNANNESVGAWGRDEQWVYRDRRIYLYFRNGKLTSFQRG